MKQLVVNNQGLKTEKRKLKQSEESIKWKANLPYLDQNREEKSFVGYGVTEKEAISSAYGNALYEQRRLYNFYVTSSQIDNHTLKFDNSSIS